MNSICQSITYMQYNHGVNRRVSLQEHRTVEVMTEQKHHDSKVDNVMFQSYLSCKAYWAKVMLFNCCLLYRSYELCTCTIQTVDISIEFKLEGSKIWFSSKIIDIPKIINNI